MSWVHGGDLDTIMPEVHLSDFFEFKQPGTLTLHAQVHALVLVKEDHLVPVSFELPYIQLKISETNGNR
jgi:hypothetical protein